MPKTQLLFERIGQIGESLSKMTGSLALIGLGSIGRDLERLDSFSNLDFFVIVKPGRKSQVLDNLSWLTRVAPTAYYFKNSPDGYKLLYGDGVFCEFAVFEEDELEEAVLSPGRVIWKAQGDSQGFKFLAFARSSDCRYTLPLCLPNKGQEIL